MQQNRKIIVPRYSSVIIEDLRREIDNALSNNKNAHQKVLTFLDLALEQIYEDLERAVNGSCPINPTAIPSCFTQALESQIENQ